MVAGTKCPSEDGGHKKAINCRSIWSLFPWSIPAMSLISFLCVRKRLESQHAITREMKLGRYRKSLLWWKEKLMLDELIKIKETKEPLVQQLLFHYEEAISLSFSFFLIIFSLYHQFANEKIRNANWWWWKRRWKGKRMKEMTAGSTLSTILKEKEKVLRY